MSMEDPTVGFDYTQRLWNWEPDLLGTQSSNGELITEQDVKSEQLSDRTPEQVGKDDMMLWLMAHTYKGLLFANGEHMTMEALEARNVDNDHFNRYVVAVKECFEDCDEIVKKHQNKD